ncbi:formin-2-like protein, partial [Euroglyphus maynei]
MVDFDKLEDLFCLPCITQTNNSPNNNNNNNSTGGQQQSSPSNHGVHCLQPQNSCTSSTSNSCPNSPRFSRRCSATSHNSMNGSNLDTASLSDQSIFDDGSEQQHHSIDSTTINFDVPLAPILDSKRSLNVNIFLKQYKGSGLDEVINLIATNDHQRIGLERLRSLKHLLPDEMEMAALRQIDPMVRDRLPLAERFLIKLIAINQYRLKIDFMLLREEYDANIPIIERSTRCISEAAEELMQSDKLRQILALVLISGNFLNFGGYAGDAIGFKIMSLQKLAEIRSNKPGLYMIHYVAMQAEKKDLNSFYDELPTLIEASKISNDNLKAEVKSLSEKIAAIKSKFNMNKSNVDDDQHLYEEIGQFLTISEHKINHLQTVTEHDMEKLRKKVANFFCEDIAQFKLEQCFQIFIAFVQRFKIAVEENRKRNENEQKIRARQQKQQCTEHASPFTSLIEN